MLTDDNLSSQNLPSALARQVSRIFQKLERLSRSRFWLSGVVSIAVLLAFFASFPDYHLMKQFVSSPRGKAIGWWLAHPLENVPVDQLLPGSDQPGSPDSGYASHDQKLTFRITIPLIHKAIPLGVWTLILCCNAAGVLIFVLVFLLVKESTGDPVAGALATWALALTNAGCWGFHDSQCGDDVAIFCLLGAMLSKRSWLIFIAITVAAFTDERSLFATPLVLLFHFWRGQTFSSKLALGAWYRDNLRVFVAVALAGFGYVGFRTAMSILHPGSNDLTTLLTKLPPVLRTHLHYNYPLNIFMVFKILWLVPVIFLAGLANAQGIKSIPFMAYFLAVLLVSIPAIMVYDIERSFCYLLPGILIPLSLWPMSRQSLRTFLLICILIGIVWILPPNSVLRYLEPHRMGGVINASISLPIKGGEIIPGGILIHSGGFV